MTVRLVHVVAIDAREERVVHLPLGGERLGLRNGVLGQNSDDVQAALAVLLLEFDEPRDLDFARAAPGRPEIEQYDFAFERGELHLFVVQILECEVQVRRLGVRWTGRAGGIRNAVGPRRRYGDEGQRQGT